jgi:hypothetical protein
MEDWMENAGRWLLTGGGLLLWILLSGAFKRMRSRSGPESEAETEPEPQREPSRVPSGSETPEPLVWPRRRKALGEDASPIVPR